MDEASSRDIVIGAVRRAAASWHGAQPEAFAWPATPMSREALVAQFVARAQAADASVFLASSCDDAVRRVADILSDLKAEQAIVSGDGWGEPWNLGMSPTSEFPDFRTRLIPADAARPAPAAVARSVDAGVTAAHYGIAETGTIVVCSGPAGGRVESLLPPVHIALLDGRGIVPCLSDALAAVDRDRRFVGSSAVTLITGPSRTADIELTLTLGVHGPKQLFIVVVDDRR